MRTVAVMKLNDLQVALVAALIALAAAAGFDEAQAHAADARAKQTPKQQILRNPELSPAEAVEAGLGDHGTIIDSRGRSR